MTWLIICITGIAILGIYIKLANDTGKDEADLQGSSLDKKFSIIINVLNDYAFDGTGKIVAVEPKTKWAFNLYDGSSNQIIKFMYLNGNLSIEWRYKYYQKEVVHKKQFTDVRNLSVFEQQKIANTIIEEMEDVIFNHKNNVVEKNMSANIAVSEQTNSNLQVGNNNAIASVIINGIIGRDKFGFIDTTGKIIIKPNFDYSGGKFSEGLVAVSIDKGKKYGYIDISGKFVIEPKFDCAYCFREGIAPIKVDNKIGYIDKTGKYIAEPQFGDSLSFFKEGFANVSIINGGYGFIDKTGKLAFGQQFDGAGEFSEGLATIRIGDYRTGKSGFIDKTGKIVIDAKFDSVGPFNEGYATVSINAKKGFIDKTGKIVIDTTRFDNVGYFSDGIARVTMGKRYSSDEKHGYIDKNGNLITEIQFISANDFQNGLARVCLNGKIGYIDKQGHLAIPAIFDYANDFQNGLARVRIGDKYDIYGKWGFIDKTGRFIIEPTFDYAREFSEKLAAVNIGGRFSGIGEPYGGKWGYIDEKGKIVIPLKFDFADSFEK
jgi:hypothetical protein